MARIVSFCNNKGGVAKTATVIAMAEAWGDDGLKVLCIDLDSQGNLTLQLGKDPIDKYSRTITDAILEKKNLPVVSVTEKIDLVPANLRFAQIEAKTTGYIAKEFILSQLLEPIKDNYDIIVLDCPPALGFATTMAMLACDFVVIPTQAESLSYAGMRMIVDTMREIREYKKVRLAGVIITKHKANKLSNAYLEQIKKEADERFVEPVIHEAAKLQQAIAFHENIYTYDPSCRAVQEYREAATVLRDRILNL